MDSPSKLAAVVEQVGVQDTTTVTLGVIFALEHPDEAREFLDYLISAPVGYPIGLGRIIVEGWLDAYLP